MKNDNHSETKIYVFWLFHWLDRPIASSLRLVPHYQKCTISRENLTIHDKSASLIIPLLSLHEFELYSFYEGNGALHTENLRLVWSDDMSQTTDLLLRHRRKIFLVPADVFDHYMDDNWELKNMYEVIRCYKSGEEPTIETNPYHRMLLRRGQSERVTERNWEPNLHPSHYDSVPTVFSVLKRLVLTIIIGSIIFTFISVLIYYIVTTFF